MASFTLIPKVFKTYEKRYRQFRLKELRKDIFNSQISNTDTIAVRPLLSGHPPLSGHFPKSRFIC